MWKCEWVRKECRCIAVKWILVVLPIGINIAIRVEIEGKKLFDIRYTLEGEKILDFKDIFI